MTKVETQIFKSGIFRFFEFLKKNKSIDLNYSYLFVRTSIYPVLIPFTTLIIVHPLGEVKKIQKEHTL